MYLKIVFFVTLYITHLCDSSGAENNTMTYQQTALDECEIDPSVKLKDCRDIDGKSVVMMKTTTLPGNTSCILICRNRNETFQVMCRDGIFKMYLPYEKPRKDTHSPTRDAKVGTDIVKLRTIRSFGQYSAAGSKIGSFFGPKGTVIGGAIGLVVDVICLIFCSKKQPPPNQPPSVTKQAALLTGIPIYAAEGKTSATVTWEAPTISDPEDGSITVVTSPSNFKSGKEFPEGDYVVYFSGTDRGGLSVTVYLYFVVKGVNCLPPVPEVIIARIALANTKKYNVKSALHVYISFCGDVHVHRCGFPRWPENGYIDCESRNIILGTKCDIRCKSGYMLEEPAIVSHTCKEYDTWDPAHVSDCRPRECKPTPDIENGEVQCLNNKAEYDNICEAICYDGFQVRGPRLLGCDTSGEWGLIPECKDIEPPIFVHCPDDMQVYIDSPNNTALVTWDEPKGDDNSGEDLIVITEIHGYEPGRRFDAGSYTIQYTIEDNDSNRGDSCFFSLNVLTLSCTPPDLGEHLKYDCPDTYRLGAECSLTCKSGYPKAGADKIVCVRDTDSNPPMLKWKWKEDELKPFCKITNCSREALEDPENGAFACSDWTHGQLCQMQCNDQYDISSYSDGFYVCGTSTGLWRPSSYVPDCNRRIDVENIRLPNEFYYYTGKCNNSAETFNEIQENFVKALNTSNFIEECVAVPECQAKFVDVTCGPISSRRKRSLHSHGHRRAVSYAYIINFDFILPYKKEAGERPDEIFEKDEKMLYKMSDRLRAEADSGHFDIEYGDLYVDGDSYGPGVPSFQCEAGMIPRVQTASCVGCPKGHYATEYGSCEECPFGTFQNSSNSLTCEPCPQNTNTTETRSENITQCLEYCKAGEFSPTKLAPCTKCPSNSFQSNTKSESCVICDNNQRTPGDGAIENSQCQDFDVQISAVGAKIQNKETHDVMTLFMWIYVSNALSDAAMEINKSNTEAWISLKLTPALTITHLGVTIGSEHTLPTSTWSSVAFSIDKSSAELALYANGEVLYVNSTFSVTSTHVLEENNFIEFHGDMKISAFSILQRKALPEEIRRWSSTCSPSINGSVISIDDLAEAESVQIVVPSVCDAVNECTGSPCGTHKCINKHDDYKCMCSDGFTGKQCQIPPDFCENNNCQNGATCVSGTKNYTCQCPYGYSGERCQLKAADGQWSEWSSWTGCSKSCGGGVSTRVRKCDSPPPDLEGNDCSGKQNETSPCKEEKCPECLKLRRTYGLIINCNVTTELQRCSISCKPHLYLASTALPYYECGVSTGYKWNHQNINNTKARLPACSEIKLAQTLGVEFKGSYKSIPCTPNNKKQVKASLETKMSHLHCTISGTCHTTVNEPICSNESRRKRTTESSLMVTIGLEGDGYNPEGSLNLDEILQNSTEPTQELIDFVNQTIQLEKSAQEMLNDSVDFFQVTVDGENHTLESDPSALTYEPTTKCPSGTVRIDVFCAESPIGSYSDGETVIMCPAGQYQDETGKSSCKQCLQGKTTDGIGSIEVSDCSVVSPDDDKKDKSDGVDEAVLIGVSVTASLLLITIGVVVVIVKFKHVNKKINRQQDSNIDLKSIDVTDMPGKTVFTKQQLGDKHSMPYLE